MGTFVGHLVPGLALLFLGLWHAINTIHIYYLNGSTKFMLRFWYPFKSPYNKLKHLELILIISFSIFAIFIQILDLQHLHLSFELDSIEHATIFLQLVIFAGFALFTELTHLSENTLEVYGILVSSIFGQELFLLHYHSTDHIGLEGHYHWLMQLIVCASFVTAIFATTSPNSFPPALILALSVIFQGCWFINMGFMLWVRDFVPRGCIMNNSNNMMHGAVVCETNDADFRARALANLQFCWIFSAILIFMASICVVFGRRCVARRQLVEYDRLSSRGADDPVATVGFKQIQL
ncbi:hypothetical protein BUALT_Bualt19G0112300 [Buddleja alternifolia]|uniref:Transmembrane protein 45A n=1 Tax=Buddleja alternifolia TaxID=168488 RepID=A0AAV6WB70_9LAMI|nr:hypothetical protein BUALT_Bualt19G0112300 [Buddleja alternifolia]